MVAARSSSGGSPGRESPAVAAKSVGTPGSTAGRAERATRAAGGRIFEQKGFPRRFDTPS